MTQPLVLAIDQGTSSTKAVLVDGDGAVRARSAVAVRCAFPQPGWVEQDPLELWRSVVEAIDSVLAGGAAPGALAVANQRESVLIWDRADGRPLGPCVGWQCRRGTELTRRARARGAAELVEETTGLPLDPSFSAPKLQWLLDSDPRLRPAAARGEICAGTVDSWLVWQLTGGRVHATDAGNASRTLLFDLRTRDWSDELLALFDVPRPCLPAVVPSWGEVGEASASGRLPSTPIATVLADSHAALYSQGCGAPGTAKATFGTGTSVMAATGAEPVRSRNGLATTIAWAAPEPTYALEGNILSSGATVRWVADLLRVADEEVERLAASVPDAGGVHLVPAFAGLGAPYWDAAARGRIEGLTFSSGRAQLARAAVESIAYQVADLVEAIEADLDAPLRELRVDGGAGRNDALVQLQADLLGKPVLRSASSDGAAVGAALLAGAAAGLWSAEDAVERSSRAADRFEPAGGGARESLAAWREAVARGRSQAGIDQVSLEADPA
jgi:glycerol kinase